jgi:hypothetical protein
MAEPHCGMIQDIIDKLNEGGSVVGEVPLPGAEFWPQRYSRLSCAAGGIDAHAFTIPSRALVALAAHLFDRTCHRLAVNRLNLIMLSRIRAARS